jgi:hypothetical protein
MLHLIPVFVTLFMWIVKGDATTISSHSCHVLKAFIMCILINFIFFSLWRLF